MAPTGILAEQLFTNISSFLLTNKIISKDEISYLAGNTSEKEKMEIKEGLKSGLIKVAVGTHALIEDPVEFKNLEFVVIDEQHRFGVAQRKKIRSKGPSSHLLVMTATPIPRTLALTIFGDLDLSIIDEVPPGRKEIKTIIIAPQKRSDAYKLIREIVDDGSQVFIVYPLIESDEDDGNDANAAVNTYNHLKKEVFPDLSIGLLHGRLKSDEKEKVMLNFRNGFYQILVTTTVIEVGVDVPNATMMMIEGANRFGLSQLHQLRGRVGRGIKQSYCLLVPENEDAIENERLKAMIGTNDGFKLAEIDLSQRGPGDFIGIRQSGYKEIRFSNIMNVKLIEKARSLAKEVVENDPNFINDESHLYKMIMSDYLQKMIGEKS
jgi:ATP-dependent DNA helicase RecG